MNIEDILEKETFSEYRIEEIENRNAVEFHAMTSEHVEILGQFMDRFCLDTETLKKCLILGITEHQKNHRKP